MDAGSTAVVPTHSRPAPSFDQLASGPSVFLREE